MMHLAHTVVDAANFSGKTLMSLQPPACYPVPEATTQVARAAFPKGNVYTPPTILPKRC